VNGGFLLDTNIPSELMRHRPEPKVQDWVAAQDIGTLFCERGERRRTGNGICNYAGRRAEGASGGIA
jgi:hypothetical protein